MKKMMLEIRKSLPTVQKKACILRKLILGCRKVSFPKLLEEVSDYISVLKMQVQAMKALVDVLATSASSPAPIGLSKWSQTQEMSTKALGYHKVVEENRKLYNMVQDLKDLAPNVVQWLLGSYNTQILLMVFLAIVGKITYGLAKEAKRSKVCPCQKGMLVA
ncbi:hypothetical protein JHK82_031724 [Glycine max]|nr:hypothetical protein JHK85_032386 [Glycine max]KAG4994990.1 hypothetical protein JHK86_031817 [Glycine max]KAG5124987.1 hypothetical protein JHK82_031724 [Glycine max]KAG5146416.1 hypothetical protein JHK84_031959 [Glycine max]